ncbi:Major facilitator superfamily domain containing protein [Amanita muscaria]
MSSTHSTSQSLDQGTLNGTGIPVPWWKIPSPLWLLCLIPFSAIAMVSTLAPRIEIYTLLACKVHNPDVFNQSNSLLSRSVHNLLPQISAQDTQRCASDPVVQAAVAKLIAAIAASAGILGCLTGAWWGAFSDRYGRTTVLMVTVSGALVTDLNFILVTLFTDKFPGGYWFLIVGPLIEGAFGGMSSGSAASHAYIADTTTEESRSRMFSLSLGLLFTGVAIGPAISSLLIRSTGQLLSVFFLSACLHLAYALAVLFMVPESLTKQKMQASRKKHQEQFREAPAKSVATYMKGLFRFLAPLTVLAPSKSTRTGGKDWSLTLIALGYGLAFSITGSVSYVLQYAASAYNWTSVFLGYYVALIGAIRAVVLLVVFPLAFKYLRPKPIIIELPLEPSEEEPLLSGRDANASGPSTVLKEVHPPSFDLNVARICIAIEVIAYGGMSFSLGALPFTLFTMLGSLGVCFGPLLQSAALAIYTRQGHAESGRLFGGLSVVQALCGQIISPSLYGFVYINTVEWFPRAIFVVSVLSLFLSFLWLCMVRLPKEAAQCPQSSGVETSNLTAREEGTGPSR